MKKIIIILLLCLLVSPVLADKWVTYEKYENVTVVAYSFSYPGNHILTLKDGRILACPDDYWTISEMMSQLRLNRVGTLKMLIDDGGFWKEKFGWVQNKTSAKTIKKTSTSKTASWRKANRELPTKDTIVLVKYKDGLYTTAYLDDKKEWKLATDKDKLFGGNPITTIIEWRIIK